MNHLAPKVYFASKLRHAPMWREWKKELSPTTIRVVSTWHDSLTLDVDELDPMLCHIGWHKNRMEIMHASDYLLVFATKSDPINGTLIEIGMALAMNIPIFLVGDYPWGTWRHMTNVNQCLTLHHALCDITGVDLHHPIKEHLDHDPS